MSKNFKGYMGDQIGKLGTAVGRKWKRKMVYASYQGKVRNPRTDRQMLVRARFGLLSTLAAQMRPVVLMGLKQFAEQCQSTEGNCFVRLNYGTVSGSTPEGLEVSYDELLVSKGALVGVQFGAADFSTPNKVAVAITAGYEGAHGTSVQDMVYLVAYCPELGMCEVSDGTARRSSETVELTVPAGWQGMTVYVYGLVHGDGANNAGSVSESRYVGSGVVA